MKNAEKTKAGKSSRPELIVSIVLCVLFIPIIVINVTMIVQTTLFPEHLPSVFTVSPVVTLSGSMSPTFEAGSLIFIHDVDPEELARGDIICYLENGQTAVTHRIEETYIKDGIRYFVTKGDANNTQDKAITADQIEGKYFGHIDGAGDAVLFLQSTTGMILFIALPIVIYLVFDFWLSTREKRKEKAKSAELEAELEALKQKMKADKDNEEENEGN